MNYQIETYDNDYIQVKEVDTDLNHLTKKYKKLQENKTDFYDELINTKDDTIHDLNDEIEKLKENIDELALIYNDKIQYIREQHKKDLYTQHVKYVKKINKFKSETSKNSD